MRRLQVTLDGLTLSDFALPVGRSVIGRRPDAQVHIDNPSVSGHHAAITIGVDGVTVLEDLASTNGTLFKGVPIRRRTLESGDSFTIGRYRVLYTVEAEPSTEPVAPAEGAEGFAATRFAAPTVLDESLTEQVATLQVLTGPAAGRVVQVTKPTTTLGKTGVSVAVIERHGGFYMLAHRQGAAPTVNGAPVTQHASLLNEGDVIEIAGSRVQFGLKPL